MSEETKEIYAPGQQAILKLLQWGAWTAAFVAILNIMHSQSGMKKKRQEPANGFPSVKQDPRKTLYL